MSVNAMHTIEQIESQLWEAADQLRANSKLTSSEYCHFTYCLARSYNFRENAIKSMVGSSGRQRVQTSCFEKFVMGLPPRSLLTQFDETAKGCFEQISNLTKQNQKLRAARDLLLPKLMNGEIAV